MAGVAVVLGDLAGPNEVWLLPDRAATDKKVVGKVVRLEKELADLCCEEGEVVEGAMVAVRFGDGMARAEVVVAEEEVVLCNCILMRGGVYDEISPEPSGNPSGSAIGVSLGLRRYFIVYPSSRHNTVTL